MKYLIVKDEKAIVKLPCTSHNSLVEGRTIHYLHSMAGKLNHEVSAKDSEWTAGTPSQA